MMYTIVGLGNPGEEYESSRHNVGRMALESFREHKKFDEWEENKKIKSLETKGKVGKYSVLLLQPETFMNKSGSALGSIITSKKKAENLVILYDDIDLPLGTFKISYRRSSGGHRGLESIIRSVKTKDFIRLRIGISPKTPSGKIRKPKGEKKVLDFVIGNFKKDEIVIFKKMSKKINEALDTIISDGKDRAMNIYN